MLTFALIHVIALNPIPQILLYPLLVWLSTGVFFRVGTFYHIPLPSIATQPGAHLHDRFQDILFNNLLSKRTRLGEWGVGSNEVHI